MTYPSLWTIPVQIAQILARLIPDFSLLKRHSKIYGKILSQKLDITI